MATTPVLNHYRELRDSLDSIVDLFATKGKKAVHKFIKPSTKFGAEIECCQTQAPSKDRMLSDHRCGLPLGIKSPYKSGLCTCFSDFVWSEDCTVQYTADEFKTPVLQGQKGAERLKEFCYLLQENGFVSNETLGAGAHTSINYKVRLRDLRAMLIVRILWDNIAHKIAKRGLGVRPALDRKGGNIRLYEKLISILATDGNYAKVSGKISGYRLGRGIGHREKIVAPTSNGKIYPSWGTHLRRKKLARLEFRSWEGTVNGDQWLAQVAICDQTARHAASLHRRIVQEVDLS